MLLGRRADSRRVLVLGVAGLVPAALVTLLLVHRPAIGARALYPMLRWALSVGGLALALATLVVWTTTANPLHRTSLSGLAWAGVTVVLCIGPFVDSTPRARLFALDLRDGRVVWASTRAARDPTLSGDELVFTDEHGWTIGLDPATGREHWRHEPSGVAAQPVTRATGVEASVTALLVPGERVLAAVRSGAATFVYVATPGVVDASAGAVIRLDDDGDDGTVRWRRSLPAGMAVEVGTAAAVATNGSSVVVAGGERIGVLDARDGRLRWSQSVVDLGKSRGYVLPGSMQQVTVTTTMVYLSATPDG